MIVLNIYVKSETFLGDDWKIYLSIIWSSDQNKKKKSLISFVRMTILINISIRRALIKFRFLKTKSFSRAGNKKQLSANIFGKFSKRNKNF